MNQLTEDVCNYTDLDPATKEILNSLKQQFGDSAIATIETYMSELVDMLSIAERRFDCNAANCAIGLNGVNYPAEYLRNALFDIKGAIANCMENKNISLSWHQQFVQTIHNTLQSGKLIGPSAVDYFTLNYDTLLEDALALERVPYSDGFLGGTTGWWDDSCFDEKSRCKSFQSAWVD